MPAVPFPGFRPESPFTIAILEDDYGQMEVYLEQAEHATPNVKLIPFYTEGQFRDYFANPLNPLPNGFILDLFVRWSRQGELVHSVKSDSESWPSDEAGLRCKDLIRERSATVPIVLWTVIETDHMNHARFQHCIFRKKRETTLEQTLRELRPARSHQLVK